MKRLPGLRLATLLALLMGCSPTPRPPAARLAIPGKTPSTVKKAAVPAKAEPPPLKEAEEPVARAAVALTGEPGILRAEVVWKGPAPLPAAKAEECFVLHHNSKVLVPPPVPVQVDPSTHGVTGVMAWLVRPPANAAPALPGSASLVQSRGVYRPAVQIVSPGTVLELRSGDDSADFQAGGAMRFGRTLHRGESSKVVLARPGLLTIHSGERPWMAPAHVLVLEHGYHAISGKDGKVELPRVPPGDYSVTLRHATAGKDGKAAEVTVAVKLGEGQGATIRWRLP
jgi:hypothetical protein